MNFTKLNNNGLVDGFGILTKCEKKTSSRGGAYDSFRQRRRNFRKALGLQ